MKFVVKFLLLVAMDLISERICRKEEFECVNEGLSPHAKQCIHESYRCDGNRDCDDGSDEFNCPKIDDGKTWQSHISHLMTKPTK